MFFSGVTHGISQKKLIWLRLDSQQKTISNFCIMRRIVFRIIYSFDALLFKSYACTMHLKKHIRFILETLPRNTAEQIKIFTARKDSAKNKRESLKSYLAAFLQGKKWQNSEVAISWRKSESVEVDDIDKLPEQYQRVVTTVEANKKQLKADLKSGVEVAGVRIIEKQNIQIK